MELDWQIIPYSSKYNDRGEIILEGWLEIEVKLSEPTYFSSDTIQIPLSVLKKALDGVPDGP